MTRGAFLAPLVLLVALLAAWLPGGPARAADALVVIVHPGSKVDSMRRAEVVNLFMGRYKKLPSGMRAVVLDNEARKAAFYAGLVNKTLAEINAYWARLTFSGQTSPPLQLREEQVLEMVASTPGALGYIDRRLVNDRVKVVYVVEP